MKITIFQRENLKKGLFKKNTNPGGISGEFDGTVSKFRISGHSNGMMNQNKQF